MGDVDYSMILIPVQDITVIPVLLNLQSASSVKFILKLHNLGISVYTFSKYHSPSYTLLSAHLYLKVPKELKARLSLLLSLETVWVFTSFMLMKHFLELC